ncbi:MAG: hypothetical protein QNK37_30560 [Acidobacteriota bacterium]|nr:hypothetical protein [Acidobacteriota bacterium]
MTSSFEHMLDNLKKTEQVLPEDHPSVEQMLNLANGKVPADLEEHLLDHISVCRDCCDLFLALKGEIEASVTEQEKDNAAGAWQGFQETISEELVSEEKPSSRSTTIVSPSFWKRLETAYSLAAIFFCTLVLFLLLEIIGEPADSTQTVHLSSISEPKPRPNPQLISLTPLDNRDGMNRAPASAAEDATIAANADEYIFLLLTTIDTRPFPDYLVSFISESAEITLEVPGLTRIEDGSFVLTLPPNSLASGLYTVRTFGIEGSEEVLLDAYSLRISTD